MATRNEMWDELGADVDILIIGGGINGAGIARDAARRGLSVALVEMKDLAYGTSSRSSKLVHGGLRYLENLEFSLVFEAVSERRILLDIAPHMVNPLGFLFPVYKQSRRGMASVGVGMWLYDGLSLFRSPKRHRKLNAREIAKEEPTVRQEDLKGAQLYFDCSTDDARLTIENAIDAAKKGATICTWTKAKSFLKDENGRLSGAVVEDVFTGKTKEVRAHVVINATGPWTDDILKMSDPEREAPILRPTKGVHAVVPYDAIPVKNAVVCFHPEDRRVLFAIPWGDRTYLGTTDTDYEGDPGAVLADGDDIHYLITAANFYFPDNQISETDVISTWAGLRPLIADGAGEDHDESQVSREHQIIIGQDGLITIAGGKLTTFRRMSAEVVDTAVKFLRLANRLPEDLKEANTDTAGLPGAVGWPPDDDHERVAKEVRSAAGDKIDMDIARNLANTYGMIGIKIGRWIHRDPSLAERLIEGRPEILAQVDWGVKEELAATATDIMIQRTQIFYRDQQQGLGCVRTVAERMAELLNWSESVTERNITQYEHDVKLSRQWKETY